MPTSVPFSRNLPLNQAYQVIVVGGGPAGCAAAIAAAREGAKTLLVEAGSEPGGMSTAGLVPWWCGFENGGGLCANGIALEILEQQRAALSEQLRAQKKKAIDPERLKRLYDTLLEQSGADVLFSTRLAAVETDGAGTVTHGIFCNKSGLTAYSAPVFIDATGDGDLAAWAGARFSLGDEYGEMQNATMCFVLSNVNMEAYAALTTKQHRAAVYPNGGRYPLITDDHCVTTVVGQGCVAFNAGSLYGVDGTRPESVSETLIRGRKQVEQLVAILREKFPEAYGNAVLIKTQSALGVREGRRILGDYELTEEDYFSRRSFPDEIARNCYHIDSHETPREAELIRKGQLDARSNLVKAFSPGESHGIPYRCLTPADLRNVLVAGRCISARRRMQSTIRVMAVCLSTGEAAGRAAAMAAAADHDVHKVSTELLREKLREGGALSGGE